MSHRFPPLAPQGQTQTKAASLRYSLPVPELGVLVLVAVLLALIG